MRVIFKTDKAYDAYMVWEMLKDDDPSGVQNRAKSMSISPEVLKQIYGQEDYKTVRSLIKTMTDERYVADGSKIDQAISSYQIAWDKISRDFSNQIERITATSWKYSEYEVVLSPFHRGISNRNGNVVVRSAFVDPDDQKRITAHEIVMTHLWSIIDARYPAAQEDKLLHFWALNEIATIALLSLEPELNKMWSTKTQGYDQFLKNYPQLQPLQTVLKEAYLKKADFLDFLDQAIATIDKEYTGVSFL